jgi:hypothetical protein
VSGYLAVWYMNGATRIGYANLTPHVIADLQWKIVAVGDYNRDGKPDLVWRDTTPGGQGWLVVWLMDGPTRVSTVSMNPAYLILSQLVGGPR